MCWLCFILEEFVELNNGKSISKHSYLLSEAQLDMVDKDAETYHRDLIERCHQHIGFGARPVRILSVDGDGNCLAHAISRAITGSEMWSQRLRKLLQKEMEENHKWYLQELSGVYTSEQISEEARNAGLDGHDMEPIHIFAFANVLYRPIILLGGDYTSGTYLPIRRDPKECTWLHEGTKTRRSNPPIFIAWSSATLNHFVAILGMKGTAGQTIYNCFPPDDIPPVWNNYDPDVRLLYISEPFGVEPTFLDSVSQHADRLFELHEFLFKKRGFIPNWMDVYNRYKEMRAEFQVKSSVYPMDDFRQRLQDESGRSRLGIETDVAECICTDINERNYDESPTLRGNAKDIVVGMRLDVTRDDLLILFSPPIRKSLLRYCLVESAKRAEKRTRQSVRYGDALTGVLQLLLPSSFRQHNDDYTFSVTKLENGDLAIDRVVGGTFVVRIGSTYKFHIDSSVRDSSLKFSTTGKELEINTSDNEILFRPTFECDVYCFLTGSSGPEAMIFVLR